jgi:CHAT domain-containing protein
VFGEMAARRRLAALSRDPKVGALARKLAEARAHYADLAVRGEADPSKPAWRALLAEARTARDHAERDLAEASAGERAALGDQDAGWDEIVRALPAGVALVSFVRVARAEADAAEYVALLWPPGATEPEIRALGDARAIDDRVARVLAECRLAVRERVYRRVAGELRERVWDPLEPALVQAKEICIVPDGALVLLDFAALPIGEDGYLIDRAPPFHYLSTERDLLPERDVPPGRGLLACGGPDFDHASETGHDPAALLALDEPGATRGAPKSWATRLTELDFGPLTSAASEARGVAALWDRHAGRDAETVLLTGAEATEDAFGRLASGRAVLHLATHGFFLPSTGSPRGATRGSQPAPPGPPAAAFAWDLDPDHTLISGLAFAGANVRTAEGARAQGLLLAEEICALDLSGVRLAVLSACDTGLGQVQAGEGVFGLRRAFQIAGVRTLVTSLWPVVDATTEERMLEFYRGWLEQDESVAEALRSAALRILRERRARHESTHPFHWAGFLAVGGRD